MHAFSFHLQPVKVFFFHRTSMEKNPEPTNGAFKLKLMIKNKEFAFKSS